MKGECLFCTRPDGYFCTAAGLTEQTGEQRDEGRADQHHAAASHELFYPQLGVKLCSMAGGSVNLRNVPVFLYGFHPFPRVYRKAGFIVQPLPGFCGLFL